MKAVVQTALGEPADVLELVDLPAPSEPGPDEVVIDIGFTSVHHGDLHLIRSQGSIPETGHVRRGSESVGTVSALGSAVAAHGRLRVGDRVAGFPARGSWAESVVVPAAAAIAVPPQVPDEVAAQLFINSVTARMVLRTLRASSSEQVLRDGVILVTGASAVVARMLLALLGEQGLTPIALARSAASARRVAAELARVEVCATEDDDWSARLTSFAAGRKIVGVLDCVSGSLLGELVPLLADGAVIVLYGGLSGECQLGIPGSMIINRRLVVRGVTFPQWFSEVSPDERASDLQAAIVTAVETPSLFKVASIHDLTAIRDAVAAVEAPNRDGFVLLKP